MDINQVMLIGRLTKDPEIRVTNTNISVASFTIAVNGIKDEVDYFNIVAWRQLADICAKYIRKGKQVAVVGKLKTRTYDAKDGSKRYITEVVADNIQMLSDPQQSKPTLPDDIVPVTPDDDLPF